MQSRLSTLVAAAALSIATSLFAQDGLNANPSAQALGGKTLLPGTVSPWLKNAQTLGPADAGKRVLITAYLGWRNPGELQQLLQDQTDPDGARYGEFLTPAQFHAEFSPRPADVNLVQNTLRSLGFNLEYTPDSGLFVRASGTVAQVRQAFRVSQNLYSYRGKTLRAHAEDPSLPAALSAVVTYIGGLDDSRRLMRALHVNRAPAALRASAPSSSDSLPQVQPPYGFAVTYPCSNYWGDTRATVEGPTAFPYGSTRSIAPLPRSTRPWHRVIPRRLPSRATTTSPPCMPTLATRLW